MYLSSRFRSFVSEKYDRRLCWATSVVAGVEINMKKYFLMFAEFFSGVFGAHCVMLSLLLVLSGCCPSQLFHVGSVEVDASAIPVWNGVDAYTEVNQNVPYFDDAEKASLDAFEEYAALDNLGRCGIAYANICQELMPAEKRGEIGSVKPSGWHTVRYNDLISGNYLYNRCHLIGYQLAGENANEKNLITGTRYLNIEGMLGFENLIADYVKETGNHVVYRVTPVFLDEELVARGVLMEGWSVEDDGAGVCFNIFAHNVQPGIIIDYATGESCVSGQEIAFDFTSGSNSGDNITFANDYSFVVNTNSGKFHLDECEYAASMNQDNRLNVIDSVNDMLAAGYSPCSRCHPEEVG